MKLHAVIGNGKSISVRYQFCGELNFSCSGWNFLQLSFPSHNHDDNDITPVPCTTHPKCEAGDFVVCFYDADKRIFFGKVQEVNHHDEEVLITCC